MHLVYRAQLWRFGTCGLPSSGAPTRSLKVRSFTTPGGATEGRGHRPLAFALSLLLPGAAALPLRYPAAAFSWVDGLAASVLLRKTEALLPRARRPLLGEEPDVER